MSAREFVDEMRRHCLNPPSHIEPGQFYRFASANKRPGNTSCWCRLFPDGTGGVFGDWSRGINEVWQARGGGRTTDAERAESRRKAAFARARAADERKNMQDWAASRALSIWNAAEAPPEGHAYLVRKRVQPHHIRASGGRLIIPIADASNWKLTSLQFIDAEGGKTLLSGGRKSGCCIPVEGNEGIPSRVIVCEGWATGATIAEERPEAMVLAAVDAGNIMAVAQAVVARWPSAELIIAADDDRRTPGNPGLTKARDAAIATGALLAVPAFPEDAPIELSDFNDLAAFLAGKGGAA